MMEDEVSTTKETDDEVQQENTKPRTKQFEVDTSGMRFRHLQRIFKQARETFRTQLRDHERKREQILETALALRSDIRMLRCGNIFINCVAAQYLRLLTGYPLRPGFKSSKASSSYYDPFVSLMAEEIGKSVEDTALLCDRVLFAGLLAYAIGSCPGFGILVVRAEAQHKLTLLPLVHDCRIRLQVNSSLAAELPDQVALLVQAKILDELL